MLPLQALPGIANTNISQHRQPFLVRTELAGNWLNPTLTLTMPYKFPSAGCQSRLPRNGRFQALANWGNAAEKPQKTSNS
jgi:hypothetical protein